MMNIFLIGNGFDLSHGLPTKYENFLHVVDFLVQNYDSNMVTVGSVLGDDRLQEKDALIKKCYERYAAAYNDTLLSKDRINKLVEMAKKNVWFSYLLESFDEDLGWIDFEKEVHLCGRPHLPERRTLCNFPAQRTQAYPLGKCSRGPVLPAFHQRI